MGLDTMPESCTPTDVADLEARWDAIRRKLDANASVLATRGSLVAKVARGRRDCKQPPIVNCAHCTHFAPGIPRRGALRRSLVKYEEKLFTPTPRTTTL